MSENINKKNSDFLLKTTFLEKIKNNILFSLLDIKYWLMHKFQIRRSRHILRLKLNGFNPIMFTELIMEDTFVFETEEEATKVYHKFECNEKKQYVGKFDGWWYSIEEFNKQALEDKKWNSGINDRFWIKKGYGLDVSEGYVKIIRTGSNDSSVFVRLTNAKI